MTIPTDELKPCPFCGHFPFHRQLVNDGRWETACQTVSCMRPGTGIRRSEAEAIAAWNTRSLEPEAADRRVSEAEVEKLASALLRCGYPRPPASVLRAAIQSLRSNEETGK